MTKINILNQFLAFQTWRLTHAGQEQSYAFAYAKFEGSCPESAKEWHTFEVTWQIKENFHVDCTDLTSLVKPILPDCCHTLTVSHPECHQLTGDICGTYKYDAEADPSSHNPIYNKDCSDEKFLAYDKAKEVQLTISYEYKIAHGFVSRSRMML